MDKLYVVPVREDLVFYVVSNMDTSVNGYRSKCVVNGYTRLKYTNIYKISNLSEIPNRSGVTSTTTKGRKREKLSITSLTSFLLYSLNVYHCMYKYPS